MNSQKKIVKAAGLLYIIIIVLGVLNSVFIDARLIIPGDINQTINNITANQFLFRLGIAGSLILYILVIILSVLLYLILKNVNKNLALTALIFRTGEALMGVATVLAGFVVLGFLNNRFSAANIGSAQLSTAIGALLSARADGLYIILALIGVGGTLFLYLFYKSSLIPAVISVWGMLTYLSMLVLSLIVILFPGLPKIIELLVFGSGALFELTIGFWLLIKGVNFQKTSSNNPGPE
ncbi:MAG TPA: DUF4386 domain-containing protein [Ignavibacteriaceae bacterium]|nr:DUF4386 domain-containing protein [Ignavibacteriaceae bacterium]